MRQDQQTAVPGEPAAVDGPSAAGGGAQWAATVGGLAALVCWSTTVPLVRSIAEQIGAFPGGAISMLAAGALGLLQYAADPASRPLRSPRWRLRLVLCGGLFVAYQAGLLLAIGLARGRSEVLVVGALNYLWPVLALVLSVPILRCRCTAWIVPGGLLAIVGEVLVVAGNGSGVVADGGDEGGRRMLTYALAAGAAVCWAVYSNLTRRLAGASRDNPVPLFLLMSGLVLAVLSPGFPAGAGGTSRTIGELAFMAAVPLLLAYSLWDRAMGCGHATLVTVASYLVPAVSAGISCWYLQIQAGWTFWTGTALLVVGAMVSYRAFAHDHGQGP